MTADEIIAELNLKKHPEGGWYCETWRAQTGDEARASGTAIYFLLRAGERSHWHRVDATEIWHYYAGAPLSMRLAKSDQGPAVPATLGPNLSDGHRPQVIVPAHHWQSAETNGDWTLVGCTVSPAFEFSGFELAAPDFDIPTQA